MRPARLAAVGGPALWPAMAQAECLGPSCQNALAGAVLGLSIYALLGLGLLGLLLFRKWRVAGRLALGVLAVAVGLPLLSQGWLAWKVRGMEQREVAGTPPALRDRVPLMIAPETECYIFSCDLILDRAGEGGILVLRRAALSALDPAQPIDLSTLPLELWQRPLEQGGDNRIRPLGAEEARAAAARIDYLVISTHLHSRTPGPVEEALRQHPDLGGMRAGEVVILAMAPLPKGGPLTFAALDFDLLDLSLAERALGLPLMPFYAEFPASTPVAVEAAIAAICPDVDEWDIPLCRNLIAGPGY